MKKTILNTTICSAFTVMALAFPAMAQDYSAGDPVYSPKYDVRGEPVKITVIEETTVKHQEIVDIQEVETMAPNFFTLDKDKSKDLSKSEFTSVDGFDWNIFEFLDDDRNGVLSEEEYKAISTIAVSEDGKITRR